MTARLDTGWIAIVPIKPAAQRKTRLAGQLSAEERRTLTDAMLAHVLAVLDAAPGIAAVVLLAAEPPPDWRGGWIADQGRGLNAELDAARARVGRRDILIVHADLPLLTTSDIARLLEAAARSGLAVAPDRHLSGTNAVAARADQPLVAVFGPDSARRFSAQGETVAIVRRPGLAIDVDTPADLALAHAAAPSAPISLDGNMAALGAVRP